MKTSAPKENPILSKSSQSSFNKNGGGSSLSSTNEVEQPFFSANFNVQKSPTNSFFPVGNNASHTPFLGSNTVIQTKLTINEPGDKYEQEADAMADQVMRMTSASTQGDGALPQTGLAAASSLQRQCATCGKEEKIQRAEMEEEESLQRKFLMRKADGGGYTASPELTSQLNSSQGEGNPLPGRTLASMNHAFGADFSTVRVHTGSQAAEMSEGIQAKAFTHGRDIYFNRGQFNPEMAEGKRLLGHELTHVVQQRSASSIAHSTLQREMKFEFQTYNRIFRNDGKTVKPLDRKYGPKDFIFKGNTGVRLESEHDKVGYIEFETEWFQNWTKLSAQIKEAFEMTQKMDKAPLTTGGRRKFPFDVEHLRTGLPHELKKGVWDKKAGKEGINEKILGKGENLEVEITDKNWTAGIQSSESFLLAQYESFLKEHEWIPYKDPVIDSAHAILNAANTNKLPANQIDNLRNFLLIIVNYIERGKGGTKSKNAGAFADVKGLPAKQAFALMSRTSFSSMYRSLLSDEERSLFKKIVEDKKNGILPKLGLDEKSPFFIKGYGTKPGPNIIVYDWLKGIYNGKDLLSAQQNPFLSAAMGKFDVDKENKKNVGLIRFETRNRSPQAPFAYAKDWEEYAKKLFNQASIDRARSTDKGGTGLEK